MQAYLEFITVFFITIRFFKKEKFDSFWFLKNSVAISGSRLAYILNQYDQDTVVVSIINEIDIFFNEFQV